MYAPYTVALRALLYSRAAAGSRCSRSGSFFEFSYSSASWPRCASSVYSCIKAYIRVCCIERKRDPAHLSSFSRPRDEHDTYTYIQCTGRIIARNLTSAYLRANRTAETAVPDSREFARGVSLRCTTYPHTHCTQVIARLDTVQDDSEIGEKCAVYTPKRKFERKVRVCECSLSVRVRHRRRLTAAAAAANERTNE